MKKRNILVLLLIAALFIACWNLLSGREHAGNTDEIDEEFIEEAKNSRTE